MHNITRPKEFKQDLLDEYRRYIDDKAYRIWIPASSMFSSVAFPAANVDIGNTSAWMLTKAAGFTVLRTFIARPLTWLTGTLRTEIYYSGSNAAAATTFAFVPRIDLFDTNTILTAPYSSYATVQAVPKPVAINQVTLYDAAQSLAIDPRANIINVQLTRNTGHASDTNAGDAYLLGLWLVYTEANTQIGLKAAS